MLTNQENCLINDYAGSYMNDLEYHIKNMVKKSIFFYYLIRLYSVSRVSLQNVRSIGAKLPKLWALQYRSFVFMCIQKKILNAFFEEFFLQVGEPRNSKTT